MSAIINNYAHENLGVRTNISRILNHGKLMGSGKIIINAIDQGYEHGPIRCFKANPAAYDPAYHFQLAIEAGFSAIAAPLGFLQVGASQFMGQIPMILKINSANSLTKPPGGHDQAITATVTQALQLGCCAIGFTIYPGAENCYKMQEELTALSNQAKQNGLGVVVWSYPRGNMSKQGETALDIVAYGAHMACLMGADIVKVKLPSAHIETTQAQELLGDAPLPLNERIEYIVKSCFDGKRIVIFSGGEAKDEEELLSEIKVIAESRAHGSIVGRNVFKRPRREALSLVKRMVECYR